MHWTLTIPENDAGVSGKKPMLTVLQLQPECPGGHHPDARGYPQGGGDRSDVGAIDERSVFHRRPVPGV